MKGYAALAIVLSGLASIAMANEPAPSIIYLGWDISLDAQGHIDQLTTTDTQVPGIHERLEQEIRRWRFSPGKVNGVAQPTDSGLQIALSIKPIDSASSTVQIIGAWTGHRSGGKTVPPSYPVEAARRHRQGLVLLDVQYDSTGKVSKAVAVEGTPRNDYVFVKASVEAVRKWVMAPEIVGGHPLAGSAVVPLCYSLQAKDIVPQNCDWRRPGSVIDMPGEQAFALDPAAKLVTDVVGHAL